MVSETDLTLLRIFDKPADVADAVQKWHVEHKITGEKALQ